MYIPLRMISIYKNEQKNMVYILKKLYHFRMLISALARFIIKFHIEYKIKGTDLRVND